MKSINVSFQALLQILFIALKLCGKIDWSWWWVLSPTWIPLAILVFIFGLVFLVFKCITGK